MAYGYKFSFSSLFFRFLMADKELVAKGENWARTQRERLEQAANEKATQLRRIYDEHLEWFNTHTIE